jgi:phosphatidylglycerol:prolipoprotein diacylglycerol transferase
VLQIPNFNPEIFRIGPFALRWYALAYVAGILLGWRYAATLLKRERIWGSKGAPITTLQLDDLILWLTLGIILGGRLGYVIAYGWAQHPPIWVHPLDIFKIWDGGMSFHGGLLGVVAALVGFAWRNKAPLLGLGDMAAVVAPIGLFFGRVANFVNGELWGRKTDLPWGMIFCNENIRKTNANVYPTGCPEGARHPSQLYEAGLEGIALGLILWWAWRAGWLAARGRISGMFLVAYGLCRALLETVREPDNFMPAYLQGHLTMGMVLSIPMMLVGLWLIWRSRGQAAESLPADA